MNNIELRIARMESMYKQFMADTDNVLLNAYQMAVEREDEEEAAKLLRKIRNNLLSESDKECAIDRILPKCPETKNVTEWIQWLTSFSSANYAEWANYRQNLRDLTAQDGFPFDVIFPERPGKKEASHNEDS